MVKAGDNHDTYDIKTACENTSIKNLRRNRALHLDSLLFFLFLFLQAPFRFFFQCLEVTSRFTWPKLEKTGSKKKQETVEKLKQELSYKENCGTSKRSTWNLKISLSCPTCCWQRHLPTCATATALGPSQLLLLSLNLYECHSQCWHVLAAIMYRYSTSLGELKRERATMQGLLFERKWAQNHVIYSGLSTWRVWNAGEMHISMFISSQTFAKSAQAAKKSLSIYSGLGVYRSYFQTLKKAIVERKQDEECINNCVSIWWHHGGMIFGLK